MSFITHQTIYLVAENQRPGNFKMSFIYHMQPQTLAFTYTDDSHCMRSQTNFETFMERTAVWSVSCHGWLSD